MSIPLGLAAMLLASAGLALSDRARRASNVCALVALVVLIAALVAS